jgi:hypothetical protein
MKTNLERMGPTALRHYARQMDQQASQYARLGDRDAAAMLREEAKLAYCQMRLMDPGYRAVRKEMLPLP